MNTILLTLSKIILTVAILGPLLEWLFTYYPILAVIIILLAIATRYLFWQNGKFKRIDDRFGGVDSKLHIIDLRLDQHQVAIETLDKKVTNLQNDIAEITVRVAVVETKVDGLSDRIDNLEKNLEKLDAKMDKRFDRMENFMLAMLESNRRLYTQIPRSGFNQD